MTAAKAWDKSEVGQLISLPDGSCISKESSGEAWFLSFLAGLDDNTQMSDSWSVYIDE